MLFPSRAEAALEEGFPTRLLGADPTPWLLASDEPYTVWVTLTRLLDRPRDDVEVLAAREAAVADARVIALVDELPSHGAADAEGRHSPQFLPNSLNLLADLGVGGGDFELVDALLDEMLERQGPKGRFEPFGRYPERPRTERGSLVCDTYAIADVLMRFGRGSDPRVGKALDRMLADLGPTPQGIGWQCVPERRPLLPAPGRKADACPQVTLEALRAFSQAPASAFAPAVLQAARTPLEVWRRRVDERPHAFGHGYQFKSVKWPNFWYDVLWVLETVARYPHLWESPDARGEDRRSIAELAACLVAYNFDPDGRLTPRRTHAGFERFSFGRKTAPSPFATARALAALAPLSALAEEIAAVDVERLPSSKGGTRTARPPSRKQPPACPIPASRPVFPADRAVWRVLARQHLVDDWEPVSLESVVADVVGLHATMPTTPYLSLASRLPAFGRDSLDAALYSRRSLVRFRCMRGTMFVVRRGMVAVAHAATTAQVVRYAKRFAEYRGVTQEVHDRLAPLVLEALAGGGLTTAELRARLAPGADVAALVTLMCAEGLLLRDRPRGGWTDRRATYVPFATALPDVRLGALDPETAAAELVRAYLRGFGPATAADAAWWTGLGLKRTTAALAQLEDEVVPVRLADDEREYLVHSADVDEMGWAGAQSVPSVHLLPALDPMLMGYADKSRFLEDAARRLVFDRAGNITSVILVDGLVRGVWDTTRGERPEVLVHMFDEQPALVRSAVERAAAAAGRFRCGQDVGVRSLDRMIPLADRPTGWVGKPLRET